MKNKIIWIFSIVFLCTAVAPINASVKQAKKEVKEKKPKDHTPGCSCGNRPPNRPKFTFWFNWK